MNARKIWTELFQKPAGRLVLFLLIGGIFLAFLLTRRGPQPKPDNTPVASQATQAKSYSFKEDIKPLSRTEATPSPREPERVAARPTPTPKPPPPIPQTIFATKEQSVSDWFLPYGRLLRCELVNAVDSTNIDTPIIGLVIEDAWNDGRVIIPAGTEVHGAAQKSAVRERIGSDRQWFLVFQDGRELPISGAVLDYAPQDSDSWAESDGSAGLRGFVVKSDKYAEAKAILASMISAGAGAFPETTTLLSPFGGATQLGAGGIESAFSAGLQAGGQLYSKRLLERLKKESGSGKGPTPAEEGKANPSNDFSFRDTPDRAEDEISDPGEIVLFPRSEADCQAFLVSQMRLNNELAKAHEALERRKLLNRKQGYDAKVKAWLEKPEQAELVHSLKATISPEVKPERQVQALLNQAKNYIRKHRHKAMSSDSPNLVSVRYFAARLGVNVRTVWRLMAGDRNFPDR